MEFAIFQGPVYTTYLLKRLKRRFSQGVKNGEKGANFPPDTPPHLNLFKNKHVTDDIEPRIAHLKNEAKESDILSEHLKILLLL